MKQTIFPGDKVLCDLHPDRGVGKVTLVTGGRAFVYWGRFGKMADRQYELCDVSRLRKPGESQERRRRFVLQKR